MRRGVLIVAFNARHIACSARRAGWVVHAATTFPDDDLARDCENVVNLVEFRASSKAGMAENAEKYCNRHGLEGVVLGPGYERLPVSDELVLGTPPGVAARAHDKARLAKVINKLDIPHPKVYRDAGSAEYPCIVKPRARGGGHGIFVVRSPVEVPAGRGNMLQEYVEDGYSASVSLLGSPGDVRAVCVNRIHSGDRKLNAPRPYAYSGNLTPYRPDCENYIKGVSEELCLKLKLLGSVGVDFIISKRGPMVLEVNPRFQGSLDSVELSSNSNIFAGHVAALGGEFTEYSFKRYAARGVLFAPRNLLVAKNLHHRMVADQTPVGTAVEGGSPLASPLGVGRDMERARAAMYRMTDWCLGRCRMT